MGKPKLAKAYQDFQTDPEGRITVQPAAQAPVW